MGLTLAERLRKLYAPVGPTLADDDLRRHLIWMDVCAVVEKAEGKQAEALAIMEKHGFIFETPLHKPNEERTPVEMWEKLAFTLYTTLCEIDVPVMVLAKRLDEVEL
jgi:hypothetical protein